MTHTHASAIWQVFESKHAFGMPTGALSQHTDEGYLHKVKYTRLGIYHALATH